MIRIGHYGAIQMLYYYYYYYILPNLDPAPDALLGRYSGFRC